ncbi:MAG: ABC transporter ATP-binding protein [Spirochaetia bacterium]
MSKEILRVNDLRVHFHTEEGQTVKAVDGVSFSLKKGESLAIVGESGSGKSVTNLSILGLIPPSPGVSISGEVLFHEKDLLRVDEKYLCDIRGNRISMIFQDPMTALNPFLKVSTQIMEPLMLHQNLSKMQAKARSIELLERVGIQSARTKIESYPHQLSGGMRQRVMIAIALACQPEVLIADEPTSALDVTIQAQIIDLIQGLSQELDMSVIMITHDLGVVAGMADQVVVMYAGRTVEQGNADQIFYHAKHPYTQGLIRSVPRLDQKQEERLYSIPGQPPDVVGLANCCPFWPRCEKFKDKLPCQNAYPPKVDFEAGHSACCWLYGEKS